MDADAVAVADADIDTLTAPAVDAGAPEEMRVLVTGDRTWECPALAVRVLARLVERYGRERLTIVHGACPTGVDRCFDRAARLQQVRVERHPADWDRYKLAAGPIRNTEMVDLGAALCLAVHPFLPKSKGTRDCVLQALAANIPVYLVRDETGVLLRIHSLEDVPRK